MGMFRLLEPGATNLVESVNLQEKYTGSFFFNSSPLSFRLDFPKSKANSLNPNPAPSPFT
ncbi:hypothetical protein CCACVL1_01026 [Corchorus capsularis]|uniref:Uncharacterized protein n=1 Tax=Corchorus capsularis TaxID=210143 RepID=A0A1R3KS59_COCAP|nr:hypothetical protein CCACVL1_01026 [Corchorus capsularis]